VNSSWTAQRGSTPLYADTDDHVSLILRTLRIDEARWRRTVTSYAARCVPGGGGLTAKLHALRDAYADWTPSEESMLPDRGPEVCPACGGTTVVPAYARSLAANSAAFAYGRCSTCGHGVLLDGRAPNDVYASQAYYQTQSMTGVGYSDYAHEREYREQKGARLLEEASGRLDGPVAGMLEVGSGFGYTRAAAESRGMQTFGVDLNPFAAATARDLYGMDTFVGTLGDALASGSVAAGAWDLLLYNFVLEHIGDVDAELTHAASALRPGGALLLVVPSMDAAEVQVFGGSYRSFRGDHLHIFSRRSIELLLVRRGFAIRTLTTTCSAHLLRGFLTDDELHELYASGLGPDMTIIATRT
jgi:SAM-dependent methyltransferase